MNQFKSYKDKLDKKSYTWHVINDFDFILNNIWSTYSFEKGKSKWLSIQNTIESEYRSKINIELGHVELGHGREQSLMAVKSEMERYVDYLINL